MEIITDKKELLEAIKKDCYALRYASDNLRDDKEVVLTAVKQYGYALEYASKRMQNDKEVVLEAMKDNDLALEFASEELQAEFREKWIEGIEREVKEAKSVKK